MKSFLKILIIILVSYPIFASCSDKMEYTPTSEIGKNTVLKDVESAQIALNGIYSTMYRRLDFVVANAHHCFGNTALTLCADLLGEDMVHTASGAGWFWKDYTYQERKMFASKIHRCYFVWKYYYQIINNANYILDVQNTILGNQDEIDNLMGQAYAIRAYSYFMLIQFYQQTYKGHEELPGVPIYTSATNSSTKGQPRGTVQDTYDQINYDIDTSLVLLENANVERKHKSHLDYYAVNLLKARVALVQNDWTKAVEAATEVMKKPGVKLLSMQDATIVKGKFDNATNAWKTGKTPFNSLSSSSVLWGAEIVQDQSQVFGTLFSHMDACTDKYYAAESPKCISNWLYAQIPDTDVRKGWWNGNIGIPKENWKYGANINYNQFKFQWKDQLNSTGDYIFMRLEEAYLIRAEALCRLERFEEAKNDLRAICNNRDTEYESRISSLTGSEQTFGSVGTVTTLMDEILLQRRIELWGETGRIHDILRLGKSWTRYWEINGEKSNHTDYLSKYSEYLEFPADFMESILLIPQVEIDINPAISTSDQNPYKK